MRWHCKSKCHGDCRSLATESATRERAVCELELALCHQHIAFGAFVGWNSDGTVTVGARHTLSYVKWAPEFLLSHTQVESC